jgi:hypothetical protein
MQLNTELSLVWSYSDDQLTTRPVFKNSFQICTFYLPTLMALTNHKGRAHSTLRSISKRVQCSFCSDTICSLQQYYKHANKEHKEIAAKEWHCCDVCNFFLPSLEALTNHKGRAHSARYLNTV